MNQPPTNQPSGPNQPLTPNQIFNQQFYNDQTQAYPQQPPPPPYPYGQQPYSQQPNPYQPSQPNPYPPVPQQPAYPPYQPGHIAGPPTPPTKPKRKWLIGCGITILALLICGLCSSVLNATSHQTPTNQTTSDTIPTPTPLGSHQTVHMTTYTPTPRTTTIRPTPIPSKPTSVPQPTQAPAIQPTQAPAIQPTQAPAPQPTQAPVTTGVNNNPWGYDFNPGTPLTAPNPAFCGPYFHCVTTFWKATNGYVVQCNNGLFSHSGGVKGACSRDGGPGKMLYSH